MISSRYHCTFFEPPTLFNHLSRADQPRSTPLNPIRPISNPFHQIYLTLAPGEVFRSCAREGSYDGRLMGILQAVTHASRRDTFLLKAKVFEQHNNALSCLPVYNTRKLASGAQSKKKCVKLNRAGNKMTIGIDGSIHLLVKKGVAGPDPV